MDKLKQFVKHLKAFDVVVILFYIILSVLHIIFHDRIETWMMWIIVNLCIIIISFVLAYLETKYDNEFWNTVHYWYIVPVVLITFKQALIL